MTVDLSGVAVSTSVSGPVIVEFDGQYVWSFVPSRDGTRSLTGIHTPWPPVLHPFLKGSTQVVLRSPEDETYFDEEVRFSDDDTRVAVTDKRGNPVSVDKVGHLQRIFDESSGGIKDEILTGTQRALADLKEYGGVEAYLNYGALLGAVRDGKMIGHDSDTDLCYISAYTVPVDIIRESYRVERAMKARGWNLLRMSGGDIKLLLPLSDGRDCHIDVFGAFHINGVFYQFGNRSGQLARESILPLGTIDLEGYEFPVPRDPEAMMAFLYGPNWRTPDPSFRYADPAPGVRRLNGWFRGFRTEMGLWTELYRSPATERIPEGGSPFAAWVNERIEPGSPIADIGCGTGSDAIWFNQQGHPVRAFDFSRIAVRIAKRRLTKETGSADVRKLILNELRTVLVAGAEFANEEVPYHLYARHLIGCLDENARDYFVRLADVSLRRGTSLFVEFAAHDPSLPEEQHHLVRRFGVQWFKEELEARGLVVVEEEQGPGTDMFGEPDPLITRMQIRHRTTAEIEASPNPPRPQDKEADMTQTPPPPARGGLRSFVKRILGRGHLESVSQRVEVLEQEVQENRELHRRIAELTDVVTELLLPLEQADRERIAKRLEGYRESI
ncbi:SAM-dependent methyltransferase [Marmoricola sp. OAE513]|uniref:class I SAM-dependent methyltransferase n=1 Tax=Marmoricola sp. OAE513 TaxID=2817894 RepID=UPI001D3BBA33